jgi:lipoate-protein ligase A
MASTIVWRLLDTGTCDGFFNMALDEAIARRVRECLSPPTLRFYRFSPVAVTVGYHQSMDAGTLQRCAAAGIDLVRRLTGGRAVLHHSDLTYSAIAAVSSCFVGGGAEVRRGIALGFVQGLRDLGVPAELASRKKPAGASTPLRRGDPACFRSPVRWEVLVGGRKILGSAQRNLDGVLLQQGSLLLRDAQSRLTELFEPRRGVASASERVEPSFEELLPAEIPVESLKVVLVRRLGENLGVDLLASDAMPEEVDAARRLEGKYRSRQWSLDAQ